MASNQDDLVRNYSKLRDYTNFEEKNEEFNNFMYRVTEVSNIVQKLSCQDKNVQEIGTVEAERYLNGQKKGLEKEIDEDLVEVRIKSDRTVLNRRAFKEEKEKAKEETMSQGTHFFQDYCQKCRNFFGNAIKKGCTVYHKSKNLFIFKTYIDLRNCLKV